MTAGRCGPEQEAESWQRCVTGDRPLSAMGARDEQRVDGSKVMSPTLKSLQ